MRRGLWIRLWGYRSAKRSDKASQTTCTHLTVLGIAHPMGTEGRQNPRVVARLHLPDPDATRVRPQLLSHTMATGELMNELQRRRELNTLTKPELIDGIVRLEAQLDAHDHDPHPENP